jgi:hypothetical protein
MDESEHVLLSVGDAPNGIVGMSVSEEGATFVIDPGFQPGQYKSGGPKVTYHEEDESEANHVAIPVVELVEACAGKPEYAQLWHMAEKTAERSVALFTPEGYFDFIRFQVDLLEETVEAIAERLRREGEFDRE